MFKPTKKVTTALTAGVLVVASAGGAYAFWTASGSGSGSASTSAGASNLAIAQTSTISNLRPGDAPQPITGTVKNNADSAAYVATVTASITVTKAADAVGTCDASDYTLLKPTMTVGKDLAAGETFTFSGATLQFNNKADANQDGCKGATVNVAYAAA